MEQMTDIEIMNSKMRYDRMDDKCMEFSGVITEDISSLMEGGSIEK
jgi:hypothetical protein